MASHFSSKVVSCDVCHREEKVSDALNFPRCGSKETICSLRILLPSLIAGKIYVRWYCDCSQAPYFQVMEASTTTFKCCSNEFKIFTGVMAEVRCKQIVYRAELVTPRKEKIDKLTEELKAKTEKIEELSKENEEIKKERNSLREKVPFLEKSLEDKKDEIQFLRKLVESGMKIRNCGECERSELEKTEDDQKKKTTEAALNRRPLRACRAKS